MNDNDINTNKEDIETTKLVKKIKKSRKVRKGRRKQNVFRVSQIIKS